MISIFKNTDKSTSNIILFAKINIENVKKNNLKSYKINNEIIFKYSIKTKNSGIEVSIFLKDSPERLHSNYIGAFIFDFSQKMSFSKFLFRQNLKS